MAAKTLSARLARRHGEDFHDVRVLKSVKPTDVHVSLADGKTLEERAVEPRHYAALWLAPHVNSGAPLPLQTCETVRSAAERSTGAPNRDVRLFHWRCTMLRLTLLLSVLAAALASPVFAAKSNTKPETRNWSAIDTNHDHYISPEEMEAYLQHVWAKNKKG